MTRGEAIESLERDIHNAKISRHQTSHYEMAIKALEGELYYKDLANSYEKTINKLTKAISEQEPKKGHWIVTMDCEGKTRKCTCDKCEYEMGKYTWHNPNYCPNCGAKMESEDK